MKSFRKKIAILMALSFASFHVLAGGEGCGKSPEEMLPKLISDGKAAVGVSCRASLKGELAEEKDVEYSIDQVRSALECGKVIYSLKKENEGDNLAAILRKTYIISKPKKELESIVSEEALNDGSYQKYLENSDNIAKASIKGKDAKWHTKVTHLNMDNLLDIKNDGNSIVVTTTLKGSDQQVLESEKTVADKLTKAIKTVTVYTKLDNGDILVDSYNQSAFNTKTEDICSFIDNCELVAYLDANRLTKPTKRNLNNAAKWAAKEIVEKGSKDGVEKFVLGKMVDGIQAEVAKDREFWGK